MTTAAVHPSDGLPARPSAPTVAQRMLLACGLAAAALYIGLDLIAASVYAGYSLRDQAISELSARGAPTARLWGIVGPFFAVFLVAFAIGLWRSTRVRPLRLSAGLMLALAALGPLWALFPMQQRGETFSSSDLGHIVLSAISVMMIVAFMLAGAAAIGGKFRMATTVLAAAVVAAFAWTFAQAPRLVAQEPTPWLGVVERVGIYGYLVWIAGLSALTLRHPSVLRSAAGARGAG